MTRFYLSYEILLLNKQLLNSILSLCFRWNKNIKWEEMKKTTKLENPVDITEHLILRRLIFTINWKNNRIVRAWQTHKSVSYSQKFTSSLKLHLTNINLNDVIQGKNSHNPTIAVNNTCNYLVSWIKMCYCLVLTLEE